jgi:serine/threonine protein kinase
MAQINRGLSALQECIIAGLSTEYKNLLKRLLTPDAHKRIDIEELCCHPWIVGKLKPTTTTSIVMMTLEAVQDGAFDKIDHDLVISRHYPYNSKFVFKFIFLPGMQLRHTRDFLLL